MYRRNFKYPLHANEVHSWDQHTTGFPHCQRHLDQLKTGGHIITNESIWWDEHVPGCSETKQDWHCPPCWSRSCPLVGGAYLQLPSHESQEIPIFIVYFRWTRMSKQNSGRCRNLCASRSLADCVPSTSQTQSILASSNCEFTLAKSNSVTMTIENCRMLRRSSEKLPRCRSCPRQALRHRKAWFLTNGYPKFWLAVSKHNRDNNSKTHCSWDSYIHRKVLYGANTRVLISRIGPFLIVILINSCIGSLFQIDFQQLISRQ